MKTLRILLALIRLFPHFSAGIAAVLAFGLYKILGAISHDLIGYIALAALVSWAVSAVRRVSKPINLHDEGSDDHEDHLVLH